MFGLIDGIRRRLGRGRVDAAQWELLRAGLPLLSRYPLPDQDRLRRLSNEFLRAKSIEAAAGLQIDETMRCWIAVQACVPVLNLGLDYYTGWHSVVLYPGGFEAEYEYVDEAGVVHEGSRELSGEAWYQGPVILSWEDVEDGARGVDPAGNVVIHEFAHKLDLLNGDTNGMPPLHRHMDRREWTWAFTAAYENFDDRIATGQPLPMDAYAAHSPGEFFAVASEAFFVEPGPLAEAYPKVYSLLAAFYRQDPLALR